MFISYNVLFVAFKLTLHLKTVYVGGNDLTPLRQRLKNLFNNCSRVGSGVDTLVLLQPIDVNDPKYFCVQDGKKRKLRVANISSKDEGFYKCKVQDKVTSAKLYVARKSLL